MENNNETKKITGLDIMACIRSHPSKEIRAPARIELGKILTNHEALVEALKKTQKHTERLIEMTISGAARNRLCDENILILELLKNLND